MAKTPKPQAAEAPERAEAEAAVDAGAELLSEVLTESAMKCAFHGDDDSHEAQIAKERENDVRRAATTTAFGALRHGAAGQIGAVNATLSDLS